MVKINYVGFGKSSPPKYLTEGIEKYFEVRVCEDADYVFVGSHHPNEHMRYLQDKVSIFFPGEAISPDFNLYDYAIGFDPLELGDRYLRHMLFPYSMQRGKVKDHLSSPLGRKFCDFIYQNRKAHPARDAFFQLLSSTYKSVDSLGEHLKNIDEDIEPRDGNWYQGSIDAKSKYKFSVAFENACHRGYTTEKITSSFQAGAIPIYWGNPEVASIFDPKSFINCHDFPSFDAVVQEVKRLDQDAEAYLTMLNAPKGEKFDPEFYEIQKRELETFLLGIFNRPLAEAARRPSGFWNDRYREQLGAGNPSWINKFFKRIH